MRLSSQASLVMRLQQRITVCRLFLVVASLAFMGLACAQSQPIVVLLSSTEQVGSLANEQLLTGIRRQLPSNQPLKVVRLDDFSSFNAAWQAALYLNPALLISPLHKADVQQVIQSSPKIPVIALNQSQFYHPQVWQFALTAELPSYQLARHLAEKNINELLLLSVNAARAQRLAQSFVSVQDAQIKEQLIYQDSDQLLAGLYAITGFHKSRRRIGYITQLIEEPVMAMPWLRQDVEALVLFAPLADALEVSHQVDYAWGQSFSLYWIDTGSHSTADYVRSLPNWGRMKTFMPFFQIEAMQQQRAKTDSFFTALGEDAMRVAVLRLSQPVTKHSVHALAIKGATGWLSLDAEQRIQVRWPLVWLGDGQVELIEALDQDE